MQRKILLSFLFSINFIISAAQTKAISPNLKNHISTQKDLFNVFFSLSDGDSTEFSQKTELINEIFKLDSTSRYTQYVISWASIISKETESLDTYIEDLIVKFPDFAEGYYLKGQYLFYTNQAGYIEQTQKCIELNPDLAMPYYFLANDFFDNKNYKLSLVYYNLLEKVYPKHKSLYYNRAQVKSKLNDKKGVIDDYTKANLLNPLDARVLYNRASTYIELENYSAAEKDMDKFLVLMPTYAAGWYLRGACKYYQNHLIEACTDFKKASQMGHLEATNFVSSYCK